MLEMTLKTEEAQKRLAKLARATSNGEVLNRKLGIALYGVVMRNFRDQGNAGTPWTPFAAGGRRGDSSAKLLLDTGALRASFIPFSDVTQAGVGALSYVPRGDGDAPVDLAAVHEFGTATIPARPMLPTQQQGLTLALEIYGREIARAAKGPTV